jgi:hypothetical protein
MRCDFWASFLAYTLVSLCLGHEPKARVATRITIILSCFLNWFDETNNK